MNASRHWNTRNEILMVLAALCVTGVIAGEPLELGEKPDNDDLAALLGEELTRDFALLNVTHVSPLTAWDHVKQSPPPKGQEKATHHWQEDGVVVTPIDDGEISTLIDVPETASYRVYLRHQIGTNIAFPVTLSLTPQNSAEGAAGAKPTFSDGGAALVHIFGKIRLSGGMTGKELEK